MRKYTDPGYDALDAETTARLGLPEGLLPAIRTRGERSNADQVSEASAKTVYQFIPATRNAIIEKYKIDPWLSPETASLAAGYLLKESLERNKGDVAAAVGEYHGGTDRSNWGRRTTAYINRVLTGVPAAVRAPEAPAGGRRLSQELSTQAEAVPSIAKVYDAYAAGKMDPADAAEFEADVAAGRVLLPRGAKIKQATAPEGAGIQGVLGAYFDGRMTPEERAEFEGDVAAGRVKLPAGVDLKAGAASMIPGQSAGMPTTTGNAPMSLGDKLKEAGKIAIESTLGAIGPGMQGPATKAATETALSVGTGMVGGTAGMVAGTVGGTAGAVLSGQYGTQQGVQGVEQAASQGAETLTYAPRSPAAQQAVETIGKGMQQAIPVMPLTGEMAMVGRAASAAAPAVAATGRAGAAAGRDVVKAKVEAAAARRAEAAQPIPTPGTMGSVGAAGTDIATLRRTNAAEVMEVPLTKGQQTRQHNDVQFEREIAKLPIGEKLRERYSDQNAAFLRKFDSWVDETGAQAVDLRGAGDAVQQALAKRAQANKNEINVAYNKARKSPEAEAVVDPAKRVSIGDGEQALTASPIDYLNSKVTGLPNTGLTDAARAYAVKLGIAEEANGQLVGRPATVGLMEEWRKAINDATGYEKAEIRDATILKKLIDAQTEPAAGPLFRQARGLRTRYAQNYEDIGLVIDLMNEKKGTSDAKVAAEDVFRRSIISPSSSMADVRQLRRILQTGGEDGKQAWRELQGATMRHIRDEATKNVARDERGNPIVSPAGLEKTITSLDKTGKLDFIFGKKGAEQLRAVNDLAKDVYTTPPGSVNHSNTASVLATYLSYLADFGGFVGGMPIPLATGMRLLIGHVKSKATQKRIREALGIAEEPKKVKAPVSIVPKSAQATRAPESRTVH